MNDTRDSKGPDNGIAKVLTGKSKSKKKSTTTKQKGSEIRKSLKTGPADYYGKSGGDMGDASEGYSSDEFESGPSYNAQQFITGRMRKKHAARSRGGEFQSKRQKRRIYFCCVASEIIIQELYEHFMKGIAAAQADWTVGLYGDVLYLFKQARGASSPTAFSGAESPPDSDTNSVKMKLKNTISMHDPSTRAIFIFEFGVVVFWGFSSGEENAFLRSIRKCSQKHDVYLGSTYAAGEDEMAYISSRHHGNVLVAGDVISLPETSTTHEQLVSVSYAIAQSSIVSIFEHRIESKVSEYQYIPHALSQGQPINLTSDKVGMMIGDIFVIRHDLNLDTDILDTPDVLWEHDRYVVDYQKIAAYLEVGDRLVVINKRLDMLRELLDMLQQQMESDHINNLDWIIIWLLALEVFIQVFGGGGILLGWWGSAIKHME
jgi:uncharacterized Rmd1/YagE family protein